MMPVLVMFSRSIIDSLIHDSRSIIDDSRETLQLVASFVIIIYDQHIFIVQATRGKFTTLYLFKTFYRAT